MILDSLLNKPFPREASFRKTLRNALISGLLVVLFLRVFSPFGFDFSPVESLNLFAAGYGIVTLIVISLFGFFELLFPAIFVEEKWTIKKNIFQYLVIIFLIGSANLFYTSAIIGTDINLQSFLNFQFFTLAITFVVVSALTMMRYFRSENFYKSGALKIDNEVKEIILHADDYVIELKSENEKENLKMFSGDLFYIESADNYSKVVYKKDNQFKTNLLRISLKKIDEQLSKPEFFRCQRSYIVQLMNVEKVSGNSQGYKLHLKDLNETIPVSRKLSDEIHSRLKNLNTP